MTRAMISMIWAPPRIVRMSEACPGQSTRVKRWLEEPVGSEALKEEKPRSRVMPRSLL
jgi:hypothetical protein